MTNASATPPQKLTPSRSPLSAEIIAVLSSLQYEDQDDFFMAKITQGQLPAKVYAEFKKVLEAVGGKWMRKQERHRFPFNPEPLISSILASGKMPDSNPLDFFPTPTALVDSIVDSTWVDNALSSIEARRDGGKASRVLEPSCGTGAFASALANRLGSKAAVLCIEKNPVNAGVMRAKGFEVEETDFLEWTTDERFELIVMNPPFAGKTWQKHLEHAMTFLAPLGKLVCIAPASVKFINSASSEALLRKLLTWGTIDDNEEGTFSESGTDIETVTIFFENDKPTRVKYDNYPSQAAFNFEVMVCNEPMLIKSYKDAVARVAEALNGKRDVSIKRLSSEVIAGFRTTCDELNRKLLTEHNTGCELLAEDYDFLLHGELVEFWLQNPSDKIEALRSETKESSAQALSEELSEIEVSAQALTEEISEVVNSGPCVATQLDFSLS